MSPEFFSVSLNGIDPVLVLPVLVTGRGKRSFGIATAQRSLSNRDLAFADDRNGYQNDVSPRDGR